MSRYQRRVSGPVLDGIDIFVDVPRVDYEKLAAATPGEPSATVADRVARVRAVQRARFGDARLNAEMGPADVRAHAQLQLEPDAGALLRTAVERLGLSARAFHRVLKVARTIADFEASEPITRVHIAEAIQYRERVD